MPQLVTPQNGTTNGLFKYSWLGHYWGWLTADCVSRERDRQIVSLYVANTIRIHCHCVTVPRWHSVSTAGSINHAATCSHLKYDCYISLTHTSRDETSNLICSMTASRPSALCRFKNCWHEISSSESSAPNRLLQSDDEFNFPPNNEWQRSIRSWSHVSVIVLTRECSFRWCWRCWDTEKNLQQNWPSRTKDFVQQVLSETQVDHTS